MRRKQDGFTIIELLVVMVIIAILAFILITTFTGIRERERNTERQRDIKAIQNQIEGYYVRNGRFPTLANLNDNAWREANMRDLKSNDLQDPKSKNQQLVATPQATSYAYTVTASDDSTCDNTAKDCTKYTLTAFYEGGETFVRTNIN